MSNQPSPESDGLPLSIDSDWASKLIQDAQVGAITDISTINELPAYLTPDQILELEENIVQALPGEGKKSNQVLVQAFRHIGEQMLFERGDTISARNIATHLGSLGVKGKFEKFVLSGEVKRYNGHIKKEVRIFKDQLDAEIDDILS